jgi:hypothetical protein
MDYRILFPGKYIQSADFKGKDVTLTVASVQAEEIDGKTKAVMGFLETKKLMVVNRTNAEAFRLMFGNDTDGWLHKRVTLFPAVIKDPFGDGETTAIRVRGSPDITKAQSATIQRGRKTLKVAVQPTGRGRGAARAVPEPVKEGPQDEPSGPDSFGGSDFPELGADAGAAG